MSIRKLLLGLALFPITAFAVGIESVTLMADNEGEPGDVAEAFLSTDRVQHFEIGLDETETGNHKFLVEFWAVDTTAGKDRKVTEFKSDALIANTINATISLPSDWPVGQYRLDVKMDGATIGSHEYDIADPQPE